MTAPTEGVCAKCRQTRPLYLFSWWPEGWMDPKEVELCPRCHSDATVADENNQPMDWADVFVNGTAKEIAAALSKAGVR